MAAGSYTFTISDVYGDGICCQYGNGSYSLTADSTTLASGGSFGSSENTTFTVGGTARGVIVDSFNTTKASQVSITPNPVISGANTILRVTSPTDNISVTIFDLFGRSVYKNDNVSNKSFNPGNLANGAYLVKLKTDHKTSVHKLIMN